MAKVKLLYADSAHGSVSGLTFQGSTNGGTLLRARPIPVSPKSPLQCRNQSQFSAVVTRYNSLNDIQRESIDSIPLDLPPYQKYLKIALPIHNNARRVGGSFIPADFTPQSANRSAETFEILPAAPGNTGFRFRVSFNFTGNIDPSIVLSPPQSSGKFRYYGSFDTTTYQTNNTSGSGIRTFNCYNLIDGATYFIKYRSHVSKNALNPYPIYNASGKTFLFRAVASAA